MNVSSVAASPSGVPTLTPEQQQRVRELQATEQKVRAHEAAHMAAGSGVVTGGPRYSYTYGPDGRAYAVAGEVSLDMSRERDPQATLEKAQRIQAAALAPADPSPQDLRVAARGRALQAEAQQELAQQQREAQLAQRYSAGAAVAPGNGGLSEWA